LSNGWKPEKCVSKIIENDNGGDPKVICQCETLTPVTVVNDIKGLFTNSKISEVYSEKGFNALIHV
jgi:hypothetical protein